MPMKSFVIVTLSVLAAGVAPLVGCSQTVHGPDAWPHQPFLSDGTQAYGDAWVQYFGWPNVGITGSVAWRSTNDPTIRIAASGVVARSTRFLRHHGIACQPVDAAQRKALTYDSEAPIWNGLNYREAHALAAANPVSRGSALFSDAIVLVSVDPIILVIAPGLVGAGRFAHRAYADNASAASAQRLISIGLPDGLLYDDRIPIVDGLRWCSPDLDIAPAPVQFDATGIGVIPVPWGSLHLVPGDNVYTIVAVTRE